MKKELTLRWTKTKPLTRQGRGKEEETASVASLFVLFKFKPLSKNGEYYNMTKKEHTTITELFQVLDLLESLDMQFWLDGGWGVDVLYGQQTRLHRDIDIDFDANYTDQLLDLLQERGYQIETNWLPTRVELYSKELGYIDIHPFVLNADGTSKQADLDGGWYEFQPDYFGTAVFEGRSIPCISAKGQQVFHSGYDLREKDIHDLSIIRDIQLMAMRKGTAKV